MEKFIKQLVRDAGKILKDKFGKAIKHQTKAHALDFVSEADLLVDKLVTNRIKKHFPKHAIISEESGEHNTHSSKWIIDPLDGTNNFLLGIPLFVTQLAYVESGQIKYSAIYDPIHDRLYFAKKGKGAFLNGKRLKCSSNTNLEYSEGACDFYFQKGLPVLKKIKQAIKNEAFWVRNLGSAGITGSLTAQGSLDWIIMIGAKIWDYTPPALLIREAGGVVKNLSGKNYSVGGDDFFIAGNPTLVDELIRIIN